MVVETSAECMSISNILPSVSQLFIFISFVDVPVKQHFQTLVNISRPSCSSH